MGRIQQFMFTSLALWLIQFQIAVSLPALGPESLPVESFNRSLDARSIYTPVSSPLLKRALTFADAVAKGNRLMCRLENPALLDDQSAFTSVGVLEISGWVKHSEALASTITPALQPAFNQLGIQNNPIYCAQIRWAQVTVSRNAQGQNVPPTSARFQNVYNTRAGYIVAYNNFGPAFMIRKEPVKILPDVRAWSDVTFVEWQTQAQITNQDITQLRYVIRYQISNKDTLGIIKGIVGNLRTLYFPGMTIPMTKANGRPNEKGRAILGTPNGAGVAYLLATHKAQLGHKTIESVQLWTKTYSTGSRSLDITCALFKIVPGASSSGQITAAFH